MVKPEEGLFGAFVSGREMVFEGETVFDGEEDGREGGGLVGDSEIEEGGE